VPGANTKQQKKYQRRQGLLIPRGHFSQSVLLISYTHSSSISLYLTIFCLKKKW